MGMKTQNAQAGWIGRLKHAFYAYFVWFRNIITFRLVLLLGVLNIANR